jgi:broad specificity phosphatase PhoE
MMHDRTIWLVRHGNRKDFVEPEWVASAARPHDAPLSADGVVQAQDVGKRLAGEGLAHIFCSPFLRAVETAAQIAKAVGLPVKVEHGLAEMMLLKWFPDTRDFLPVPVLKSLYPEIDPAYRSAVQPAFPESPEQARERAAATARHLAARYDGNLLLVAHGGCMHGLCEGLLGAPASISTPLCGLIRIAQRGDQWSLEADGSDTSHLARPIREIRLS